MSPSSPVTVLASASINTTNAIVVGGVEADETPSVVILRWPLKATVLHPRRFPDTAAMHARIFARSRDNISQHQGEPAAVGNGKIRPRCLNPHQGSVVFGLNHWGHSHGVRHQPRSGNHARTPCVTPDGNVGAVTGKG